MVFEKTREEAGAGLCWCKACIEGREREGGRRTLVYSAKNDGSSCMPENPSGLHADEECWPGKREESSLGADSLSQYYIDNMGALYPPPPSFSFDPRWIDDRHDETIASNSISKIGAGKVREVCVKSTGTRVPITRCRSLMARTPRVKLAESWERSRKTARKEKKERFAKLVRLRFMWETDDDEYRENHP